MSTELLLLNPHLNPIKKEADIVREAMEEFRALWRLEPIYLIVNPKDWRAGIKYGYLGMNVLTDPDIATFRLSA